MSNAVALLRGLNVGGHRITNVQLVEVIGALGLTGVMAYQASGNVLFDLKDQTGDEIEALLESGLATALGYSVPTMVRTGHQIRALLAAEPHAGARRRPGGKPQIAFFKHAPSPTEVAEVEALAPGGDLLTVIGRELYWWPDGGIADSVINWAAVARTYGPLTMRTRTTVDRIAGKLSVS